MNNFFFPIISVSIILFFVIKFKDKFNFNPNYNPSQKIHDDFVPPYGGVIIFTVFYMEIFINNHGSVFLNFYFFLPALAILMIGFIDDVFGNISPTFRFFVILLSSIFFTYFTIDLPEIEIPFIGKIINDSRIIQILFYSICLTAISNGTNMIDGMNGLSTFSILNILISILVISFLQGYEFFFKEDLLLLITLLSVFLIFNFPFGKVFLGDGGAYWLGWISGSIIIKYFAESQLSTWIAVVILIYPTTEVVFSTLRKILQGKNPLKPDNMHIHLKLYKLFRSTTKKNSLKYNSFTTVCLIPFWSSPILTVLWVQYYSHLSFLIILIIFIIYLTYYYSIPVKKNSD